MLLDALESIATNTSSIAEAAAAADAKIASTLNAAG